jgi:hypothetical protein
MKAPVDTMKIAERMKRSFPGILQVVHAEYTRMSEKFSDVHEKT